MEDDKPRTPPIEPGDYISGVKVVDFGDLRVARGMSRRPFIMCAHRGMVYDQKERRIWCRDCETDVEPFDAFILLVENMSEAVHKIERDRAMLDEALSFSVISVAAKTIDQAWRSRNMVPACPTCGHGLFPEQFKTRPTMLGKDYAEAKLKRRNETK